MSLGGLHFCLKGNGGGVGLWEMGGGGGGLVRLEREETVVWM